MKRLAWKIFNPPPTLDSVKLSILFVVDVLSVNIYLHLLESVLEPVFFNSLLTNANLHRQDFPTV